MGAARPAAKRGHAPQAGRSPALDQLVHNIQEDLAAARAWVSAESRRLGELYGSVLASIDATVGPACKEAWEAGPVTEAKQMNLVGWGPAAPNGPLEKFQDGVAWRFGLRRLVPTSLAVHLAVEMGTQVVARLP
jgi:hypothetical protein